MQGFYKERKESNKEKKESIEEATFFYLLC